MVEGGAKAMRKGVTEKKRMAMIQVILNYPEGGVVAIMIERNG